MKSGAKSGVKPGPSSGLKQGQPAKKGDSGVGRKSGAHATLSAGPPVSLPQDDLVDELLSAKSLPPSEQQLSSAPLAPVGKQQGHDGSVMSRMGMLLGVSVAGACVLVVLLLVLIYLTTFL